MPTRAPSPAPSVNQWFGPQFAALHPLLQQLHLHGGSLSGVVNIALGNGMGRLLGRLIARKFSIPVSATPQCARPFKVDIFHAHDGLHWHRTFDGQTVMRSRFVPVGTQAHGCWFEHTGPVRLSLTVDVIDGGWYWRCLKAWVFGVRIPLWLFPHTRAFKRIEDGRYRFYVGFSLPWLGTVLSYGGLLDAVIDAH